VKTDNRATTSSYQPNQVNQNETMKSLGQIAYEAYVKKADWRSPFTGQTFKEWDTLRIMNPIVAEAWECAALMVAGQPRLKVGPEQTR
jgi:hypothetical protein